MFTLKSLFALLVLTLVSVAFAQEPALTATVPAYGNPDCPIMGKKASSTLFVDTEMGRIYICCAPCIKKIRSDVATAMKSAYPVVKKLNNAICPVSGKPLTAEATSVVIQGLEVGLCCDKCEEVARKNHQLTLAKAHDPKLKLVENKKCPVDGSEVDSNAIVIVGNEIIRLSSLRHMSDIVKDPAVALKKAQTDAPQPHKESEAKDGK